VPALPFCLLCPRPSMYATFQHCHTYEEYIIYRIFFKNHRFPQSEKNACFAHATHMETWEAEGGRLLPECSVLHHHGGHSIWEDRIPYLEIMKTEGEGTMLLSLKAQPGCPSIPMPAHRRLVRSMAWSLLLIAICPVTKVRARGEKSSTTFKEIRAIHIHILLPALT